MDQNWHNFSGDGKFKPNNPSLGGYGYYPKQQIYNLIKLGVIKD